MRSRLTRCGSALPMPYAGAGTGTVWTRSSAVERPTLNRLVGGSIPPASSTCDVAQWVERSTINRVVTGSTPVDATGKRCASIWGSTPRHACKACSHTGSGIAPAGRFRPTPRKGPRRGPHPLWHQAGDRDDDRAGRVRDGGVSIAPMPRSAPPLPSRPALARCHGAGWFRAFPAPFGAPTPVGHSGRNLLQPKRRSQLARHVSQTKGVL